MDQVNAVIIGKSEHPKLLAAESYDKETVDQLLQTEPMGEVVQVPNKERHSSFGSEGTKSGPCQPLPVLDPAGKTQIQIIKTREYFCFANPSKLTRLHVDQSDDNQYKGRI